MPQIRETFELANGVRLVLDKMTGIKSACVGVWVGVGTRYENEQNNGVAHLLEHLVFKGAGQRNAKEIAEDSETRGVYLNAATSYDKTGFYARCLGEDTGFALDMCADLVVDPRLDENDIALEKNVVLHEINEAFDDAEDRAGVLNQMASFTGQPLGMPILGDEQTLMAITASQVRQFHNQYKNPKNIVVALSGAFDIDAIKAQVQSRFGALKPSDCFSPLPAIATSNTIFEARQIEQFQISLSAGSQKPVPDKLFISRVFCSILGGGMASRLFQDLREKRGLVYGVDAYDEKYAEISRISIGAGCAPNNSQEVIKRINGHLEDLATTGPTENEMARAKKTLETSIMMSLENPSARMSAAVNQVLMFGKPLEIDDMSDMIRNTTHEDIISAANLALIRTDRAASAVGPSVGEKAIDQFLA